MPHGDTSEWAFDRFREQAAVAGGAITDEMIAELREEVQRGLNQSQDNIDMMYEEEDYI